MTPDHPAFLFTAIQVMALSMARAAGMVAFLPFLVRQQTTAAVRGAVCLALSLPAALAVWPQFSAAPPAPEAVMLLALKEGFLGALLGMLTAIPFWAVRGMGTLIDNQRGANAAQQVNPALQADATLLGELAERAFIALLIDLGLLQACYTALAASHAQWPMLALFPPLDVPHWQAILAALAGSLTQALLLAGPALLLLLMIELVLAIASTAVQGLDVYASAMAVKTVSALAIVALIAVPLFDKTVEDALRWWREGLLDAVGLALPPPR
ncbi:flagellar biosynthetic protein FliR [Mitsuaria sp. GD03876]|uniref:EscT/YscT/HrcT family type III secretion system export apparatus protein n=1 Tax=Mitsuaria sp. GD03876 TaxID=2975399 RepID=UPI00244C9D24|nr:flagellar biosynthetic protein FliR [Mitsuaria sp. GD03876]MDH0865329.1 flagellar biosynthetic protein FliR [Mitsuaria sp. GD03876]